MGFEVDKRFMAQLDLWSEANVIGPLFQAAPSQTEWEKAAEQVKKAIRGRVLDSYRNGQATGRVRLGTRARE